MPPHPYIPNSAPEIKAQMLREIGVDTIADLYAAVPPRLRVPGLALPDALPSELEVERHLTELLSRNRPGGELLSFLGGGCWQHYVPAVCDEIAQRSEFLTAYWADTYTDRGKYQAFFELQSLLGELLEMDLVSLPVYDWGSAAATSLRMAARLTGRDEIVLAHQIAPERRAIIATACQPDIAVLEIDTVSLAPEDLRPVIGARTAAVYFENPSYLGVLEEQAPEACRLAHEAGALAVAGTDPLSLGIVTPPAAYGADIVCGDLQPLGLHMEYGGGLAGFIATPDDERYVGASPTFLIGIAPTDPPGRLGYGLVCWERTSYMRREAGNDFGGTTTGLHAIAAAVYLSLVGPEGLAELGAGIVQRSHYAAERLSQLPGVEAPALDAPFFKEFVVRFDQTGRTVAEINAELLDRGILGGKDLSGEIPALGQSALYCVTEVHRKSDIDRLAAAIAEIVSA